MQDHLACGKEGMRRCDNSEHYSLWARYGAEGFQYTSHLILTTNFWKATIIISIFTPDFQKPRGCFSYLLLHSEFPQNLKQQTLLLCYSFCESEIWLWLSSVALAQGLP